MCKCQWLSGRSDPLWTEGSWVWTPAWSQKHGCVTVVRSWAVTSCQADQNMTRDERSWDMKGGVKIQTLPLGLHRQYPAAVIQNQSNFYCSTWKYSRHRPSPPFFSLMNINIQPPQCPPHSSRCYLLNAQQDLIQDSSAPDTCTWRRGRLTRLEE